MTPSWRAWTLTQDTPKRLEAFEMWTCHRILKIPFVDTVTKQEVLKNVQENWSRFLNTEN